MVNGTITDSQITRTDARKTTRYHPLEISIETNKGKDREYNCLFFSLVFTMIYPCFDEGCYQLNLLPIMQ